MDHGVGPVQDQMEELLSPALLTKHHLLPQPHLLLTPTPTPHHPSPLVPPPVVQEHRHDQCSVLVMMVPLSLISTVQELNLPLPSHVR